MQQPADKVCVLGVLNHDIYAGELIPLVERARKPSTSEEAMTLLRALIARLPSAEQARPLEQYDKLVNAVQSGRWLRGPAGILLESICVEERADVGDHISDFDAAAEIFFTWNEANTHTLLRFFAMLPDHTVPWASPGDTWRSILSPEHIQAASEAMNDLTRRDVLRLLGDAEDGGVYSEEEAATLADWWDNIRRILRLANRQERGFYISVRTPPA